MLKIYYTIKDFIRILLYSKWYKRDNFPCMNYDRKILRVLGNGKSLGENSLSPNDNIEYMVVNRHVLADNYTIIQPSYYVLADPYFFETSEGEKILRKIYAKTSWKMYLFIPYRKNCSISCDNSNITIQSYNTTCFRGYNKIAYKLYDKKLAMPVVQNVIVACIMLGIYMRFSNIELYGVEHNWLKNLYVGDDNLVYLLNEHFYDKDQVLPRPQKDIQNLDEYPLYLNISHYSRMFQSYWEIREYIQDRLINTKIMNCTKGSYIDAFERC